jgi:hypothetical protein
MKAATKVWTAEMQVLLHLSSDSYAQIRKCETLPKL